MNQVRARRTNWINHQNYGNVSARKCEPVKLQRETEPARDRQCAVPHVRIQTTPGLANNLVHGRRTQRSPLDSYLGGFVVAV